jgi:hypothetical protein
MKKTNRFQNTKRRTLEVLEDKTWMGVPTIADRVGIQPVRRAYTYLAHLRAMGLVARELDEAGKSRYQITDPTTDSREKIDALVLGLRRAERARSHWRYDLQELPLIRIWFHRYFLPCNVVSELRERFA